MSDIPTGCYAIVDLMGHKRFIGRVTEEECFGSKLGRVDVPRADGTFEEPQYFGAAAVYSIRVCSEEEARLELGFSPITCSSCIPF